MKILCDDCGSAAAAVFCCADEAALCLACDRRIHRANKVAGKHSRFPLLHSSSSEPRPLCDICQERQGIVFCKEDRAILCLDCDFPIHAAKRFDHSRFILSLTSLSATSIDALSVSPELSSSSSSSISDYLIKMLPGYCVEDLLVDDPTNQVAGKSEDQLLFVEGDQDSDYTEGLPEADLSFCVPDAPPQIRPEAILLSSETGYRLGEEFVGMEVGKGHQLQHLAPAAVAEQCNGREEWGTDNAFTVPQLYCFPGSNKRPCRPSAWYF